MLKAISLLLPNSHLHLQECRTENISWEMALIGKDALFFEACGLDHGIQSSEYQRIDTPSLLHHTEL